MDDNNVKELSGVGSVRFDIADEGVDLNNIKEDLSGSFRAVVELLRENCEESGWDHVLRGQPDSNLVGKALDSVGAIFNLLGGWDDDLNGDLRIGMELGGDENDCIELHMWFSGKRNEKDNCGMVFYLGEEEYRIVMMRNIERRMNDPRRSLFVVASI